MAKKKRVSESEKPLSESEKMAILSLKIAEAERDNKSKVTTDDGKIVGSVKLRHKQLADGRASLYFDIYAGGKRTYNFIGLHLDPSLVVSETDIGTTNENAIDEAKGIRKAKKKDMAAGIDVTKKVPFRSLMLLKEWMEEYSEKKKKAGQSDSFSRNIDKTIKHLTNYEGSNVTMRQVDKDYCEGFLEYLATRASNSTGKPLAKATQAHYYKLFRMAMGEAVRKHIIASNPALDVDRDLRPRVPESTRAFLDVDEVKALINTPCSSDAVKNAYLFSCFCGLRCSDIKALTWGDIITRNGLQRIEINMVKTGKHLSLPLSVEALRWMPDRGNAKEGDKVFAMPSQVYLNTALRKWASSAGITKHLSFHTARHTFATLELTAGADLYTTSKLLGHTNIKTTQIYAKIIDKKKDEAVNRLSTLFE